MAFVHKELAAGRWNELTLMEQLANAGSDVSRALRAMKNRNEERKQRAFERALELLDLTIADPKNRGRLREICRAREVVADFFTGNEYRSDGESLDRYFTYFALAARR